MQVIFHKQEIHWCGVFYWCL